MYFDEPIYVEEPEAYRRHLRRTQRQDPVEFEFRHLVDATEWVDYADSLGRGKPRQPEERTFECAYNEDGQLIGIEGSANCSRAEWRPTPRRKKS